MKASIAGLCHFFNTHRMVREYTERFYMIADTRCRQLAADDAARARALAAWMERLRKGWSEVRVEAVDDGPASSLAVGEQVHARARVHLGPLTPDDVSVEVYVGRLSADGEITDATARQMLPSGRDENGNYIFEAEAIICCKSGLHGYTVRVLPYHPDMSVAFVPGLIRWAN